MTGDGTRATGGERADELDRAVEVLLDVLLPSVDGKDDDDLVFVDGFFRSLAEELGLDATFAEIEPMPARVVRERWRNAKRRLAEGDGPAAPVGGEGTGP